MAWLPPHQGHRFKPDNPLGKPLVLLWGPGDEDMGKEDSDIIRQLRQVRYDLRDRLAIELGAKAVVETSEGLRNQFPEQHTREDSDIAVPESSHVKWSSVIVCLDYPANYLTLHAEYGLVYDLARDLLEGEPQLPQGRIIVAIPEVYYTQIYRAPEKPLNHHITTSGSVGHFLLKRIVDLVDDRLRENWVEFLPYDEDELDPSELLDELFDFVFPFAACLQ